ncbi:hypothetical protein H8E50_02035 [bacterium]|nr:hypothetical protein [bacterium]
MAPTVTTGLLTDPIPHPSGLHVYVPALFTHSFVEVVVVVVVPVDEPPVSG